MRLEGKLIESFALGEGLKKGCTTSHWLFNIFMDGCGGNKSGKRWCKVETEWSGWSVVPCFFADNTVLLAEAARECGRAVDDF